jgi:hypothetical protein
MPTPRQYDSNADRQRAFRQRQKQATTEALVKGAPKAPAPVTIPGTARWRVLQAQALTALQTIRDEMEAYQGDRSEQWQESDRAEQFQETLDAVEEARAGVEGITL